MENTMKYQLEKQLTELEAKIEEINFQINNCELALKMARERTTVKIEVKYERNLNLGRNHSQIEVFIPNQHLIHLSLNAQISEYKKKLNSFNKNVSAYKDELRQFENEE